MNKIDQRVKEFTRLVDGDNTPAFEGIEQMGYWLKNNEDKHLFSNKVFNEPMFDLDEFRIADWFKQALTQTRQEALAEALELVGEEIESLGYNQALYVIRREREALQAKIER